MDNSDREQALCFRWYDAKENFDFDHEMWKNNNIAGIRLKQMLAYSKIDFADFIPSNESDDTIILNLGNSHNIHHTFPNIDRCCKLIEKNVKFDGIDNMDRINCDMSQDEFTETYVHKREAVMMVGCQDKWKAKNWTIENLLNRYNYIQHNQDLISYTSWPSAFQENHKTKTNYRELNSNEVKWLINNGHFVRIFKKLPKGEIGWIYGETEYNQYMLELMDEYTFPKPMPEDIFQKYHLESDQAYLMLATAETGTNY